MLLFQPPYLAAETVTVQLEMSNPLSLKILDLAALVKAFPAILHPAGWGVAEACQEQKVDKQSPNPLQRVLEVRRGLEEAPFFGDPAVPDRFGRKEVNSQDPLGYPGQSPEDPAGMEMLEMRDHQEQRGAREAASIAAIVSPAFQIPLDGQGRDLNIPARQESGTVPAGKGED